MLEGQIAMLAQFLTGYFASGRIPVRRGTSSQLGATYQAFQATDDWVVVAAFTQRMWQGVCRAVERTEWTDDPRFESKEKRSANRETLIPMLAARFATRRVDEWIERLSAEGVPCSSVNSIDKVVIDEQGRAREMIVEVEHAIAGKIRMAGLPVKLSRNPGAVRRPPPLLGEHSAQILLEIGMGADDIEALFRLGVIATPNPVSR